MDPVSPIASTALYRSFSSYIDHHLSHYITHTLFIAIHSLFPLQLIATHCVLSISNASASRNPQPSAPSKPLFSPAVYIPLYSTKIDPFNRPFDMADEQPNITTRTNPKRGKNGKEREQPAPSESTSSAGEQSQSALPGFSTEQAQSMTKVINDAIASAMENIIAPLAVKLSTLQVTVENSMSANSTKTTGANPLISEPFGAEQPSQESTFGGVPTQFGFAPRGFTVPWSRWRPEDLGTFDPDVDDVYSFIDRIRELVHSKKDPHMIQLNLSLQLRNKAKRWFELELTQQDKSTLYAPVNGVSAWIDALVERFQPSGTLLLQKLHETTYTRADAAAKKDPTNFVHDIIALTRTRPLEESLMKAYLRFESGLQVNLMSLTKFISVAEFIDQVNAKKGA